MKIGVIGCSGRMGRTIVKEILVTEDCVLSGGADRESSGFIGTDIGCVAGEEKIGIAITNDIESLVGESDAIIDFTSPANTIKCAEICARLGTIHVVGTTGLDGDQINKLYDYAKETPIIFSSNMSVGVNLLLGLVEQVASILDPSFDIEILEMHHRHKVDSPSGTALSIGKAAADGRNEALSDIQKLSREGIIGEREKGEIGFATLRGGDVIGDHTVIFAGEGERIELTHKASNRNIYAKGAVRAAKWAESKEPKLYAMKDVLGLK